MIKLGIRAHDMGKMDAKALFDQAKAYGFDGIQLVTNKALMEDIPLTGDSFESLKAVKSVDVMLLGSYFNPIHSNKRKVEDGINRFKTQLRLAHILNCDYVASETGSYNDDQWTYHINNHTESAYQSVLKIFIDLVKEAESVNKTVLIEAAYGHVIFAPSVLRRLIQDINSPNVGVIVDLYNLLNMRNHTQHDLILQEALVLLRPYIKVFHLKNYIEVDQKLVQTGLKEGIMDYNVLLPMMMNSNPDAYFIFEGITGDYIESSLKHIKHIIKEAV